jgi:hypothetical protein
MSNRWVHLRLCLTCGQVGCYDDLKIKHATRYLHSTNHLLIKSFEPGENEGWCYTDELFFESFPESMTTQWCGARGFTSCEDAGDELAQKMLDWKASWINTPDQLQIIVCRPPGRQSMHRWAR